MVLTVALSARCREDGVAFAMLVPGAEQGWPPGSAPAGASHDTLLDHGATPATLAIGTMLLRLVQPAKPIGRVAAVPPTARPPLYRLEKPVLLTAEIRVEPPAPTVLSGQTASDCVHRALPAVLNLRLHPGGSSRLPWCSVRTSDHSIRRLRTGAWARRKRSASSESEQGTPRAVDSERSASGRRWISRVRRRGCPGVKGSDVVA